MAENSVVALRKYLGTDEKPVNAKEMMDFWNSLTDEEKQKFKETDIS